MHLLGNNRISKRYQELAEQKRTGFIPFITAGDPDYKTSLALAKALGESGVDLIEIGMPFSDPMADGPTIQQSSLRALHNGHRMQHTFQLVEEFRSSNDTTPIILMGYYNPIYKMGVQSFLTKAKQAGVDGLIIVDLPVEHDDELCIKALEHEIAFIRLVTPSSDHARIRKLMQNTACMVYYVSIAGITGTHRAQNDAIAKACDAIKAESNLPIAVGFGVTTHTQVCDISQYADAVVVGSAIVKQIENALIQELSQDQLVANVVSFVDTLTKK